MLYCQSTEKFWYPSTEAYTFASPDNGGALVKLSLTWGKAIDDVTNNDLILLICCHAAKTYQISPFRVTDAYGGWCANPSPNLPTSTAVTTDTTTATTDDTTDPATTTTEDTTDAAARLLQEDTTTTDTTDITDITDTTDTTAETPPV
jgi:hypothetical protein